MRPAPHPVAGGRVYTPAILTLAGIVGVSFLGIGFVMPLRALYAQRVGASSVEIGLMASVALLTASLAAPPVGRLTQRFGPRKVLWVGVLCHAALVLLYIPAQQPLLLIGLRGLEGIAIVAVLPPARALMNTLAPAHRQGEALGLIGSAQMVGILMGPAAGALLASQVGYTPAFLCAGGTLLLGAALAWLLLPAGQAVAPAGAEPANAPARSASLFTPALWLCYALAAIFAVTTGLVNSIWAIYLSARGASLPLIGLTYTAYAVPTGLLAPFAGRISDRAGRYWPIVAALAVYAATYVVFGLPIAPIWFAILSAVEGVPAALSRGANDGLLADVLPRGQAARAQANYAAAGTSGSFVGALLGGLLYGAGQGVPFIAAGALFAVAALGVLTPAVARLFPPARGKAAPRAPGEADDVAAPAPLPAANPLFE
ncbi:MAG TPA: MFS transporter [Ktedonobacterales bacterium]